MWFKRGSQVSSPLLFIFTSLVAFSSTIQGVRLPPYDELNSLTALKSPPSLEKRSTEDPKSNSNLAPSSQQTPVPKKEGPSVIRVPIRYGYFAPAKLPTIEDEESETAAKEEEHQITRREVTQHGDGAHLAEVCKRGDHGSEDECEATDEYVDDEGQNILHTREPVVPYYYRRPSYTPSLHSGNLYGRGERKPQDCAPCKPCQYSPDTRRGPRCKCSSYAQEGDGECDCPPSETELNHQKRDIAEDEADEDYEYISMPHLTAREPKRVVHPNANFRVGIQGLKDFENDHETMAVYKREPEALPKKKGNGKKGKEGKKGGSKSGMNGCKGGKCTKEGKGNGDDVPIFAVIVYARIKFWYQKWD
ncbi:hypothetical protein BDZ91DRAFT_762906 [Kalaharituber pfeilii]|nr:hypothetical protein BDZ91DRAFT_762906 [Kalaharituber pfeilii]